MLLERRGRLERFLSHIVGRVLQVHLKYSWQLPCSIEFDGSRCGHRTSVRTPLSPRSMPSALFSCRFLHTRYRHVANRER